MIYFDQRRGGVCASLSLAREEGSLGPIQVEGESNFAKDGNVTAKFGLHALVEMDVAWANATSTLVTKGGA
jgi:hypothetical protein